MTVDEAPEVRRRSKKWWILGVIILLLVPLAAFGWSAWITHSYVQDFERWEKNEKPQLASNASLMPITAMDYPGEVVKEDLQAQEAGCKEVGETRKTLNRAATALPEIADWPLLPLMNPDYKHALDNDERRHRQAETYRAEADKVLAAMQRDCAFDTKYLAAIQRYNDLIDDADKLLDPKGPTGGGAYICEYKEGCIPVDPSRLMRYSRLMNKAHHHERSEVLSLYQSESCERTSYANACETIADAYRAYLKVDRAYIRLIVLGSYSETNAAVERSDRAWKKFERRAEKILESQHPGLGSVSTFTYDPTSADAFFAGVAEPKIVDLLDMKATVISEKF
jgi:hypothetical protein